MILQQCCFVFKLQITQMMINLKILFTTLNSESGLAFSTDARCADLHGLGDLGFLCSLSGGLQKNTFSTKPCYVSYELKLKIESLNNPMSTKGSG